MVALYIKRVSVVLVLILIAYYGVAQELPADPKAPREIKKTTKARGSGSNKVKWIDSSTINDENLGHLKVDMKLFKNKALEKTKELSNYITLITDKNASRADKNKGVDLACKLFVNDDASVEVSNAKTKKTTKTNIRTYLTNLTYLYGHFDKVVVQYVDITYVPEFRRGVDGNFYSVVTFVQKFEGFFDGKLIYGDLTKKDITVVLKNYTKVNTDGSLKNNWDVFLSDIGVKETVKMVNTFN